MIFVIVKRNVTIFFRDKMNVFLSMLSNFIMLGIYLLFTGNIFKSSLAGFDKAGILLDSWLVAGLIATTTITCTVGIFGKRIEDENKGINKDFNCSPITKIELVGGYILSAFFIGFLVSLIFLFFSLIILFLRGGDILDIYSILKIIGVIILADFTNSSMIFFITSFLKTHSAYSTAASIMGVLSGFLTGIYMPIGNLPKFMQTIVKIFPTSHAASLLRQIFTKDITSSLPVEVVNVINENLGMIYTFNGKELSNIISVFILIISGILFYILGVISLSRKVK